MIDKVIKFLQRFEKEETFDVNKLYIGDLGKMHMYLSYPNSEDIRKQANFVPDRFVIIREATTKEKIEDFKKQYGTICGEVKWSNTPDYIYNNQGIKCYKVILTDQIVPLADTPTFTHSFTQSGIYETLYDAKPIKNFANKMGVKLEETLTKEQISNLEDYINKTILSLDK